MSDAPVSKNQALRWSLAGIRPDVSLLDKLPNISGCDLTVVNGAGKAWDRKDGVWEAVANPFLSQSDDTQYQSELARPKILAITPFHPAYGIRPDTWQSIQAAVTGYTGPVDWIISHNDNPHKVGYENVTRQHNKARDIALAGDYDYLLSIEADMIIPADAIEKLLACDSDIAYGLYVWRHGMERWSAYSDLGIFGGRSFSVPPNNAPDLWGGIHEVKGLGMGCTLIKRNVLERLPFRLYTGDKDDWLIDEVIGGGEKMGIRINPFQSQVAMFCDDWLLALDAGHYGFIQKTNFGLICGHIDHDRVWWPDINAGKYVRHERIGE